MKASSGDQIRVRGNHVGQPDRCGQIVAVRGVDGEPPFLVRWEGTAQEVLFFPGSDATVEHSTPS
jgi:hypothetical protein